MPINYYDPQTMKGVIRRTLPLRTFFKTRFFNNVVTFPTESVMWEFSEDKRRLAPYVNPRIGSESVERDGYHVESYTPPLVAPDRPITNDTLAQKLLGESLINSGMAADDRAARIAAQDIMDLQNMIYRREEFMCARLKQDGMLHIKGRGVNYIEDYKFENIIETATSDVWSPGASIIGQLNAGAEELEKYGINPDMLICGSSAAKAIMENTEILKYLDVRRVEMGEIAPRSLENGIRYIGRIITSKITADIYTYSEWYSDEEDRDANGFPKLKPIVDPETVIMQSSTEENSILYGAITLMNPKTEQFETHMDPYVPDTIVTQKPPQKLLSISSRPLPMPHDLRGWMVFKNVVTGV